jgi:hypothetical protein
MVMDEAIALFMSEAASPTTAPCRSMDSAPDDYPFSRDLYRDAGIRWRALDDFLGRGGVAYDLPEVGSSRATLYVVRCQIEGLPPVPPDGPVHNTGNCFTMAWQDGDLLYVLVYTGRSEYYQYYMGRPRGPLA